MVDLEESNCKYHRHVRLLTWAIGYTLEPLGETFSCMVIADFHNGRGGDGSPKNECVHSEYLCPTLLVVRAPLSFPVMTCVIEREGGDCLRQVDETELHS